MADACHPLHADLWMCIADPHRVGHERTYYPGYVNFRAADVIIINKANTAQPVRAQRPRSYP